MKHEILVLTPKRVGASFLRSDEGLTFETSAFRNLPQCYYYKIQL